MAKKTYTAEEQAEYWKKRAQKAEGSTSKRTSETTARRRKRGTKAASGKDGKTYKKRSGCKYEESYIAGSNSKYGKPGERVDRPRITGWRLTKQGFFQSFDAYLSENDGIPKNGTSPEICRSFVVNITTKGVGTSTEQGVYNLQHRKLSITKLELVANPFAANGGYFGRGGSRYKDKVK